MRFLKVVEGLGFFSAVLFGFMPHDVVSIVVILNTTEIANNPTRLLDLQLYLMLELSQHTDVFAFALWATGSIDQHDL